LLNYRNTKNKLHHFHESKRNKKMFKKTLLAVAIAAVSTGAMAVNVSLTGGQTYGHESLTNGLVANDGGTLTLGADGIVPTGTAAAANGAGSVVTLKLGAQYTVGDTITISLAGGKFAVADTFVLEQVAAVANAGADEITLSAISKTATAIVFRVTAAGTSTTGLELVLNKGAFSPFTSTTPAAANANALILNSTAVGSTVTVSAAAATSTGIPIDVTTTSSKVIGTVIQEHKFTVDPAMAAKIDVAKARKEFTTANAEFGVKYATFSAANQASFVPASTKYTLNGSFAGFEKSVAATDNDGTIGRSTGTTTITELAVAADLQSAAITIASAPSDEVFRFAVDGTAADRVVLSTGNYTVDVVLSNANGANTTTFAGLAVGSHTLNGSSAQFAYVPVNFVGAVTSQFEVGNKGSVNGEITISAFDTAGNDYSAVLPFVAEAGKLTKIGDDDIAKAFGLTKGTKLNLTITVNAPTGDITYGGYSNRGTTGRMSLQKIN
jgi:hypothetical protein